MAGLSPDVVRATAPPSRIKWSVSPSVSAIRSFWSVKGGTSEVIYPMGISTSLPADVQEQFVRSIPGLANARILRPGYAVEYDVVLPDQLWPSLETKAVRGLFCAGQINGTSGYEEAAAQGLIAGINAVQYLTGDAPVLLGAMRRISAC